MTITHKPKNHTIRNKVSSFLRDSFIGLTVILLLAGALLIILRIYIVGGEPTTVGLSLLDAVVGGLISFAFLNLFWHLVIERERQDAIREFLQRLGTDESYLFQSVIPLLAPSVQRRLCKEVLKSFLGQAKGGEVYEAVVKRFLNGSDRFRQNYRYVITVKPVSHNKSNGSTNVDPDVLSHLDDRYVWIESDFGYTTSDGVHNPDTGKVEAWFCLNAKLLHNLLDKTNIYFRDLIDVSEDVAEKMKALEAAHLLRSIFRFGAYAGSQDLNWSASWVEEKNGIRVDISRPQEESKKCNLSFRLPQLKTAPGVFVVLPEPTVEPQIRFQSMLPNTRVMQYPFYPAAAVNHTESRQKVDCVELVFRECLFPNSGVLFYWITSETGS